MIARYSERMGAVYMSEFLLGASEDLSTREMERRKISDLEAMQFGALETSRLCGNERFRIGGGADSRVAYK